MELSICSYNCCSLRKNIDIVRELTIKKFDIIFLQETFIVEDKLGFLDCIDDSYESVGVGAVYSEKAITSVAGRPQGGIACLWRVDSVFKIYDIVLENNMCVLFITIGNIRVVLVNVYLKSDIWEIETESVYLDNLAKLGNILSEHNFDEIYIIGDFNADPYSGRAWRNLSEFMEQNYLKCFDYESLESGTVTFTSYDGSFSKWLDHVIGRDGGRSSVREIKVHKDLIGSDHLPLSVSIWFDCNDLDMSEIHNDLNDMDQIIDWIKLKENEVKDIEEDAMQYMGNFLILDSVSCKKIGCMDRNHLAELSAMYNNLVYSTKFASQAYARVRRGIENHKIIPGWNRRVKEFHRIARGDYLKWLESGRERDTNDFYLMNNSKKEFKQALNECVRNEQKERDISIEEKYRQKNYHEFWRDTRRRRMNTKKSNIIDGKTTNEEIVNIFAEKFLNNAGNEYDYKGEELNLIDKLREVWGKSRKFHTQISVDTLRKYCKSLSKGMGHDGIHSSFLQRVSDKYLNNLVHFINASFTHCFISEDVLRGDINPRIKDVKGNVTDSTNYRPVMQSSCVLKLIEMHILTILEERVVFNCRQFGFKNGSSTSDACFILKETLHLYTKNRNRAFLAFIDLSKAFDNVDHFLLGQKLLNEDIPPDLVLLIINYLRNQRARVCWNGNGGEYSHIDKGVRQGGILSPFLFKLYINGLLNEISDTEVGCKYGILRMNIIAYADDVVLVANSKENLEILYNKFNSGIKKLKLNINNKKSKCMIVENTKQKCQITHLKLGNDNLEVVHSYKYLGHILENGMKDSSDIKQRLSDFNSRFN